jgi:3-dehydroquinate dehydratase II
MLHCTLIPNAGTAGPRPLAWPAGWRAPNQLLIEAHLSNIYQRETFRQYSYASLAARGVICGFGSRGDLMAVGAPAAPPNDAG